MKDILTQLGSPFLINLPVKGIGFMLVEWPERPSYLVSPCSANPIF